MKVLTDKEQMIMRILWEHRHCSVDDVIQHMPEPKPAYNTALTFLRILEQRKFLDHKEDGRKHVYYPLIEKGEYTRYAIRYLKDNLFDGSIKSLVNTFISDDNLTNDDIQELITLLTELETTR